jgi:membrane dipeptidase
MKKITTFLLLISIPLFCFSQSKTDDALRQKAKDLAQKFIIVDTHVDVPWRLQKKMEDVSVRTVGGDFDYERAKEGGFDAPFMSIYVPSALQKEKGASKRKADSLIDLVEKLANDHPDKFKMAYTPEDVIANSAKGLISFPMGIENGSPIEDDIKNVEHFFKRGVRYITLTHAEDNLICDASYSLNNKWSGLSPFGKKVVEEMNRLGMMVDVSHVSDKTIEQVLQISKAPVIASHSSCRHFTPGFNRNLPDNLIKEIAKKGGVVQINFGSMFIDPTHAKGFMEQRGHMTDWALKNQVSQGSKEYQAHEKEYDKAHPLPNGTIEQLVDHIDYVVKLVGINHVGLGSDFDGVGDTLPEGIKDVSQYSNLIFVLLKRGYSEKNIEKICSKNTFRVWEKVAKLASH